MAPNTSSVPSEVLYEKDDINATPTDTLLQSYTEKQNQGTVVWFRVFRLAYIHISGLYGLYLVFTSALLATINFAFLLHLAGTLGVMSGAHRLWSHQSFKANIPLRVILMLFFSLSCQSSAFSWARNHRIHHKYSETNADPHNAKRGFFFSHCGWVMVHVHPEFKEKAKQIGISDLLADPLVMFQHRYYLWLLPIVVVIPLLLPMYWWGESLSNSWHVVIMLRLTATFNCTFLINSVAHIWGNRPYDKFINPSQNLGVAIAALGEGWHNYHHVFPWDYKAAELGNYSTNITTMFIDFFAWIGWAYDLKTTSPQLIEARVKRTGDGSHDVWGWNDKDLSQEDKLKATIINEKKFG
ncbi:hypothetical protein WDU94_011768 [Cyamophila willieti]